MKKILVTVIVAAISFGASANDSQSLTATLWSDLVHQIKLVTGMGSESTNNAVSDEQEPGSVTGNGGRPEGTRSVTGNGG